MQVWVQALGLPHRLPQTLATTPTYLVKHGEALDLKEVPHLCQVGVQRVCRAGEQNWRQEHARSLACGGTPKPTKAACKLPCCFTRCCALPAQVVAPGLQLM